MESLVFLTARLITVPDALALAADAQDLALMAKLAFADLDTASVFERIGELWRTDFDDDNLVIEIDLLDDQLTTHVRLNRLAREFHSRVLLLLRNPYYNIHTRNLVAIAARNLLTFNTVDIYWLIINLHALLTCTHRLETLNQFSFIPSKPEPNVLRLQSWSISIVSSQLGGGYVSDPLLCITKALFAAELHVADLELFGHTTCVEVICTHYANWDHV